MFENRHLIGDVWALKVTMRTGTSFLTHGLAPGRVHLLSYYSDGKVLKIVQWLGSQAYWR